MKITKSQLKQIIKEEISKVLTEQEKLAPGVHLAPDGSYATIVFKFDGMNFEGREEELEFPIRDILEDDYYIIPLTQKHEGDTITITTSPSGKDIDKWKTYILDKEIYDMIHQELAEAFAQQEMDL